MSNAVFPALAGLAWGTTKTPVWSTQAVKSVSGREVRVGYYSYPQWRFTLSFDVLRAKRTTVNEVERLAGFFNSRMGSLESFLYDDPTDNSVKEQLIGHGVNGVTRYRLVRSYGGFIEPIGGVNGIPVIKVGSVVKKHGTDFQVSDDGYVVFNAQQPVGQPITWTGRFYFRVRFADDSMGLENFIGHLWKAKKIELVSVKL